MLGDEGGGYWLAMQALGALARAEDGRAQRTALRDAVLVRLGLDTPRDLVDWVERATKADVAALAPVVLAQAEQGDPVAASIVTDGAAALRSHVIALLDAMERDEGVSDSLVLALFGGLIGDGGPLRTTLERTLAPLGLRLHPGPLDPTLGATELAARL
jgi:N-acetylglucosamine kinase-like BadF-type ATPase